MTPLQAALRVLVTQHRSALLDDHFAASAAAWEVTAQGRGLLKELVWGVVRHRGTLDYLIDQRLARPQRIEREVREILRLGAYQLLYLDHKPDYAAVNDTVELTRWAGKQRLVKLVNAVLRRLQREVAGPGVLDPSLYPDPGLDLPGHLAAAHSHPRWLVERWLETLGRAKAQARLTANNRKAVLTLRVNPRRTDRASYLARLGEAGIRATAGPREEAILVESGGNPETFPGYAEGHFFCQDLSAMEVAELIRAEPGMRLLEVAAAPGGKTTHLLERTDDLQIVALDAKARRLRRLSENLERLGLKGAMPVVGRGDALPLGREARFDRVLLDVPCSNTGVMARRIDLRWRLESADIRRLAALQEKLLIEGARHVAAGGCLIYSTCTLESEENEGQIARFLDGQSGFELDLTRSFTPESHWPGSGGFVARLKRIY